MNMIKNMLSQTLALEAEAVAAVSPDEKMIVMRGPLAEVFTRALDIAYAKPEPYVEGEAMESQQMDVAMMQKLAAAMNQGDAPPTNNFQTVFGVSRDDLSMDTVVDITKELANRSGGLTSPEDTHNPRNEGDFFLIIDGTQPGANSSSSSAPVETLRMIHALECLVEAHGGKVFTSLEAFAKSR